MASVVQSRSLRYTVSWTVAGTAIYACCQWGMLQVLAGQPLLAGQFMLGLTIVTPFMVFIDRAIRALQATAGPRDRALGDYLAFRFTTAVFSVLAVGIILFVDRRPAVTCCIVLLVAMVKMLDGVTVVFYGRMHQRERMELIGRSQIVRGILGFTVFLAVMMTIGRLDLALSGVIALHAVILWAIDRRIVKKQLVSTAELDGGRLVHWSNFRWTVMYGVLMKGFPIGLATFLVALNSSIPRYVLEKTAGSETLGIFAVMFSLTLPLTTVIGAMTQASMPRLASYHRLRRHDRTWALIAKLSIISLECGAIGVAAMTLFAEELLRLYGPDYAPHSLILIWITIATMVGNLAVIPAVTITAHRNFGLAVVNCLISTAACVVLSVILVPRHGMLGAAVSMLGTNLVHGLAAISLLAWAYRISKPIVRVTTSSSIHGSRFEPPNVY